MVKKTIALLIITLSVSSLQANIKSVSARVKGIMCAYCVYGLDQKLKHHKWLKKLETIDIKKGLIELTLKKKNKISLEELEEALKSAADESNNVFVGLRRISATGKITSNKRGYFMRVGKTDDALYLDETEHHQTNESFFSKLYSGVKSIFGSADKKKYRDKIVQLAREEKTAHVVATIHSHPDPSYGASKIHKLDEVKE